MSEYVNFIQGSKENYNPSEMLGGIFFSKDSKEILLNGESYGNATPADEEDITAESGNLKLKDRAYDEASFSGKGYVILRKNISDGKNVLTQEMINLPNTIYIIQYDYDLNGQEITIPEGCVLDFQGGSLSNGTINGNNTDIVSPKVKIFQTVLLQGSYLNVFHVEYWGAVPNDSSVDNGIYFNYMFNSFPTNKESISPTGTFLKPTLIAEDIYGYYFTTTISNNKLAFNFKVSRLVYQGTNTAINFTLNWWCNIYIDALIHIGDSHWSNENLKGIVLDGVQRCNITINRLSNFREALCCYAVSGSFYSNIIYLNASFYNLRTIVIKVPNRDNWANHNTVYGGTADYLTGELQDQSNISRSLIYIESNGNGINGWTFENNGIEGGANRGLLKSYYLEVDGDSGIHHCAFKNYRVENINTDCQVLLTNKCHNLYFAQSLYADLIIKNKTGEPIFINNDKYRGAEYSNVKYLFCNNSDKQRYFKPCRLSAILGGEKYVGSTLKAPNLFQSTGVNNIDNLELAIKVVKKKFYIRVYTGRTLSIRFFDSSGIPIQDINEQDIRIIDTKSNTQYIFYWQNTNNDNNTSLKNTGMFNNEYSFSEAYIDVENTNVEYITVESDGYFEIFSTSLGGLSFIDSGKTGIRIDRSLANIGCIGKIGELYYYNNFIYLVNKAGIISDVATYILNANFTSTANSNILTIDNYAQFIWIGFEAEFNGKRFTVIDVKTDTKEIITDTIFDSAYSGKLTLSVGDFSIVNYYGATDSIADIDFKNYSKGSIIYDEEKDIFNYVKKYGYMSNKLAKLDVLKSGPSVSRPTYDSDIIGAKYFDTTLNKCVYWNGSKWVTSDGLDADSIGWSLIE